MGKIEIKKQRKRTSLLDAALELFTQKGMEDTSVSDIVTRSGVAKGTFYLYFRDKYDIRNKLVIYQSRRLLREAYNDMMEAGCELLEEQLIHISNYVLDQLLIRKDLLVLIAKNLSWGILKKTMAEMEAEDDDNDFIEKFHALTAPRNITSTKSEIMLYLLVELIGASCYNAILYENPCDLETLKPYLFGSVRSIVAQFAETG